MEENVNGGTFSMQQILYMQKKYYKNFSGRVINAENGIRLTLVSKLK
jgi:hypothetical protein